MDFYDWKIDSAKFVEVAVAGQHHHLLARTAGVLENRNYSALAAAVSARRSSCY